MQTLKNFLKTPYYFQWLIVFFALDGYSVFLSLVSAASLTWLVIKLSIVAWILFAIFRKIYGNSHRAALLVTALFGCYLFFGSLQDALAMHPALFKLSLYKNLLPLLPVLCGALAVALFFYKKEPQKLTRLLNVLFIIYMLYDVGLIAWRMGNDRLHKTPVAAVNIKPVPDTIARPDVYLVILDEYLGSDGLHDYFHYDNSAFESFLKNKGFYVCPHPRANYSFTIYAMASMLNMRYFTPDEWYTSEAQKYMIMSGLINNNAVCETFKQLHYDIRNGSPFVVEDQQAASAVYVLPRNIELITDKTIYNRFVKRLLLAEPQHTVDLSFIANRLNKKVAAGHERVMQQAIDSVHTKQPTFTYLHLLMPHSPFVFDSAGHFADVFNEVRRNRQEGKDKLYFQYLLYTNKRITKFIDDLYGATGGKAVILLMSDHGYRDAWGPSNPTIRFNSLNAVYLPTRDYHLWYNGVSNVNQFPLLFNTLFNQQIPLKKDTCIY